MGSLEEGGEYTEAEDCLRWIGSKIKKNENQDPDSMIYHAKSLLNKENARKRLHHFINGRFRRKGQQGNDTGRTISKEDDIKYFFDGNLITLDIENALATGNWGKTKDGVIVKTGVA